MPDVDLFVEDFGHETFLKAMVERFAEIYKVGVKLTSHSARGGRGKALKELQRYIKQLQSFGKPFPDLLIVAIDANCKGYAECKQEIDRITDDFKDQTVCAIPDPHIERWMLIDSSAFKAVLGKGCSAPDQKCERVRYKRLLIEAVRATNIIPLLGGMEHAEDIVKAMNLEKAEQTDDSLGKFLKGLHNKFKEWSER